MKPGDNADRVSARYYSRFVALAALAISGSAAAGITDLHWLQGCWSADGREQGSTEQWMAPAGRSMIGMSRTVGDGETVAFEFLRITEDHEGTLVFSAAPSGQEAADFALLNISERAVVFENLQHDFPQRIGYRLMDDEHLLGHIEGFLDNVFRKIEFPMTKTACTDNSLVSN